MDELAAPDYVGRLPAEGDKHCTGLFPCQLEGGAVIANVPHVIYNRLITLRATPQRWADPRGMYSRVRFIAAPGGEELDAANYNFRRTKSYPNCDSRGCITTKVKFDSKASFYRAKKLYYVEFVWDADEEQGLEELVVRSNGPLCITRAPSKRKASSEPAATDGEAQFDHKRAKELEVKVEALQADMAAIKGMLHKIMDLQVSQGLSWVGASLFGRQDE